MPNMLTTALLAAGFACIMCAQTVALDSLKGLDLHHVKAEVATYEGRRCLHMLDEPGATESLTVLEEPEFGDGTIEVDVAGAPQAGAGAGARGFIGVAFHVQPAGDRFECFYLRPTNGRADDQLRRNHSTQYVSAPDYPWERLRKESPGVYESYTDLEPGVWTKMKIVVSGTDARLFVNGTAQPCLIVHDLKLGKTRGRIALWVGPGTDGHFSNLALTPATK